MTYIDCVTYTVLLRGNVVLACNSFVQLLKLVTLLSTILRMSVYRICAGQDVNHFTQIQIH